MRPKEPFTTIKQGKYRIIQKWHRGYGHYIYIFQERIWGFLWCEIDRSGTPIDLKRRMDSYIYLEI